jgi:Flp pilus assembly protein TadD
MATGLRRIVELFAEFPGDPRLHFVYGSLLASLGRFEDARRAVARSVELAPDYALARFQLGFMGLTSGDAASAQAVWRPLSALPMDNPLRMFAEGLVYLIGDHFDDAVRLLKRGIALNQENPPLNADMQLLVDKIETRRHDGEVDEPVSAAHLLLQHYSEKTTKH